MRAKRMPGLLIILSAANLLTAALTLGADAAAAEASTQDVAKRLIEGCLNFAAEQKLPPLSVALVDESGALIRFEPQNGANPLTAEAALLKARTAARDTCANPDTRSGAPDAAIRDTFIVMQLTALPDGVPLVRSDASLCGAVGVSGAEPAQETECAQRAVVAARGVR